MILTWNVHAYNTNDWQNFYYPNQNYLRRLPTGIPRTFPILVCIDPKINSRRTQLIKQAMDIWNKAYKDHVSYLIRKGILYKSDLGENIPDYKLLKILFNLDSSGECPKDNFFYRSNFRWIDRYVFITETIFTDISKEERSRTKGRYGNEDAYIRSFSNHTRIEINKEANLYDGGDSYKAGKLFFIIVMLHELGHAVGIFHHTKTSNPLMYKNNKFIWNTVHLPTKEDIEILLNLHIDLEYRKKPKPTITNPYHGCTRSGLCP